MSRVPIPPVRVVALAATVGAALIAVACGEQRARPLPAVHVAVTDPADLTTVPGEAVELRGSVRPAGATVSVAGEDADVHGRVWRAEVTLEPGANLVDVTAVADGHAPAVTVVRVTREVPVTVPDVTHLTPDEARTVLEAKSLHVTVEDRGGLLDSIIPGTIGVCDSDPAPGEDVRPGTTVVLRVARAC